jgi:DnaK suppressor protein
MRATDTESLRSWLQQRRRLAVEATRRTQAEIGELRGAERDSEVEERSQSEQEQYNLSSLGEVAQDEIARIDAVLQRLDAGGYGLCRDCGEPIGANRLAAMPFALDCAECATRREQTRATERELARRARITTPG